MNGGKSIFQVLFEETKAPASPFMTPRKGLGALVQALVDQLPEGALRLSTPARKVRRLEEGRVAVEIDGATIQAAHVLFTGPPWGVRPLLGPLHTDLNDAPRPGARLFYGHGFLRSGGAANAEHPGGERIHRAAW